MSFDLNYTVSLDEGTGAYASIQPAVMTDLQRRGFAPSPTPEHRGQVPRDLTRLTDDQLGALLGQLAEWSGYVQQQLADAEMNLCLASEQFELVAARLRITDNVRLDENGKKRGVDERNDIVRCDHRFLKAKTDLLYWEATEKMIRAIAKAADSAWQTVSRRITQRQNELEKDRRGQNVNMGKPMFRQAG